MKVIWSIESIKRLSDIESFIAGDSPKRAEKFVNYLFERGESVGENPQIGRVVPEILNPVIREIVTKKYRIMYKIHSDYIQILTVFEGHQQIRLDEIDI